MEYGCGGEVQFWDALTMEKAARAGSAFGRAPLDAPLGCVGVRSVVAIFGAGAIQKLPVACKNSGLAGVFVLRGSSIRKKIIGHRMRDGVAGFASGKQVRLTRGAFAFLQKETRKSCVRVVVHPLIKQGRNFLADIGGMGKTRQFKALQRILGSREKELPRGLGRTSGHMTSVTGTGKYYRIGNTCQGYLEVMALWKSVENFVALGMDRAVHRKLLEPGIRRNSGDVVQPVRACSACPGDYEDPDRTARMPDEDEEDFVSEKAQDKGQGKVEDETELDDEDLER